MADPAATDFPNRQPYEGTVVRRDDPRNLGQVRVQVDGVWEPYGPWCLPVGGRWGGAPGLGVGVAPPLGAEGLVFFPGGNAENPRFLCGHHAEGEIPEGTVQTANGDNKVWQDERVRVEVDARPGTVGLRVKDRLGGGIMVDVELDMASGQVGATGLLGVLIKGANVRIGDGTGLVFVNGRPVIPGSDPI